MCKGNKHHYLIETSQAPVAEGVCLKCNSRKMFPNCLELAARIPSNVRKDIDLNSPRTLDVDRIAESFARDL